jgi:hypothetical protein
VGAPAIRGKRTSLPLRFDQIDPKQFQDCSSVGMTEREVVELVQAFRLYGFWSINLDTGLFRATPDVYRIFDMQPEDGRMNLVEFRERIHPDDLPILMECFERCSSLRQSYHMIYRIKRGSGWKFVRTVGKFRDKPGTSGEIVGVTYEFFERLRTAAFSDGDD